MGKTAVIIVLYKPSQFFYDVLCDRDDTVVILVDNTPDVDLDVSGNNTVYLPQKANLGIAKAQNLGIAKAKELGCEYVVFFDQDSRPTIELVDRLISDFKVLKSQGLKVAAVGPKIINQAIGKAYKSGGKLVGDFIETDTIISSGMTTDIDVLLQVGGMEERLFIDLVDHEWCWRAQKYGFNIYKSSKATLSHQVGNKMVKIFEMPFLVSAPIRYYYQYRNYLWLNKLDYVPRKWKRKVVIRKVFEFFLIPFFTKQPIVTLKNMISGIKSGINNSL